jgi:hypothetical protein
MQDAFDYTGYFVVRKGRTASHPVPGEQKLEHHLRIDAVPEQVPGQGSDGVVALPLLYTLP